MSLHCLFIYNTQNTIDKYSYFNSDWSDYFNSDYFKSYMIGESLLLEDSVGQTRASFLLVKSLDFLDFLVCFGCIQ